VAKNQNDRISKLETKLKQHDVRITELTEQRDKAQKLNEESRDGFGRWQAAFAAWRKRVDERR
jgi:hypothetical protein